MTKAVHDEAKETFEAWLERQIVACKQQYDDPATPKNKRGFYWTNYLGLLGTKAEYERRPTLRTVLLESQLAEAHATIHALREGAR